MASLFRLGTVPQGLNHDFTFCENATAISDFAGFFHKLLSCCPNRIQNSLKIATLAFHRNSFGE